MRNIKITVEYDGTRFAGWQVQNSSPTTLRKSQKTIQEALELALKKIFHTKTDTLVSGRTDAGVHAWAQVANFKTDSRISLAQLPLALNAFLPDDIAVVAAEEEGADFHSRFCARSKVYRYLILNRPWRSALLRNMVLHYQLPLHVARMHRQAQALVGRHDFKAFCASGSRAQDTTRTISRIAVRKLRASSLAPGVKELISIEIEADGFLYNMVRSIVGTLLLVGRGGLEDGQLKSILLSKDRKKAGPTAPGKGLALVEVKY